MYQQMFSKSLIKLEKKIDYFPQYPKEWIGEQQQGQKQDRTYFLHQYDFAARPAGYIKTNRQCSDMSFKMKLYNEDWPAVKAVSVINKMGVVALAGRQAVVVQTEAHVLNFGLYSSQGSKNQLRDKTLILMCKEQIGGERNNRGQDGWMELLTRWA